MSQEYLSNLAKQSHERIEIIEDKRPRLSLRSAIWSFFDEISLKEAKLNVLAELLISAIRCKL
jgi:hypothetical protein